MRVLDLEDSLTVTKVGMRTKVGQDGGYWVEGDAGGFFWITPDGDGWYYDLGVFGQLPYDTEISSTVSYETANAFGETATASVSAVIVGTYVAPDAQDDTLVMSASDTATARIDLFANDAGQDLTVVQVGHRTKVGKDGGYWVQGDAGGHFWITPDGTARFRDRGEFDHLYSDESVVSSVTYIVEDAFGAQSEATVSVTVHGSKTRVTANDDSARMYMIDEGVELGNLLANDTGEALTVTKVGQRSNVGEDGGYWVQGDTGGHFWIAPDGTAGFWDEGDFDTLAVGETATSSVTYEVTSASGDVSTATVSVEVSRDYTSGDPDVFENPDKVGLGFGKKSVEPEGFESRMDYLNAFNASWYYNWGMTAYEGETAMEFVPMQWSKWGIEELGAKADENADGGVMLGFNEPDQDKQANLTVEEAIALWPELEATGLRLGSPAPAKRVLSDDSWLARFMAEADAQNYRVDFIALHTYTDNRNVDNLKSYLIDVYETYQKPIWITEFALVDWTNPGRFSAEQSAAFLHDSFMMLDDLEFVERYAWYRPGEADERDAAHSWHFYRDGEETAVYDAYAELMMDVPSV